MLKLPAYGRDLARARSAGQMPAREVLVTDWWDLAELFRKPHIDYYALVCAPLAAPYDFAPLQGLVVWLAHVDRDALGAAERIARVGPRKLLVVSGYNAIMHTIVGNLEAVFARRGQINPRTVFV